jgi:hypothetical protein
MSFEKYITHRSIDSFPQYVDDEIKLLSVSTKDPAIPFGSSIYRIQMYPGDIDLLENVYESGDKEKIVKKFLVDFKKIIRNIQKNKMHYYSEVKAGLDNMYDIDIGVLENGLYTSSLFLRDNIETYYEHKLITKEDYEIIMRALNYKTADAYDVIHHIIREYRILRWTVDEILKGKKQVLGENGKYVTLDLFDIAMQTGSKTLFKIDEIALFQNRFSEYTNVYFLYIKDKSNYIHSAIGKAEDVDEGLRREIEKLYFSDFYYNPFKAIKRMFALAQSPNHNTDPKFTGLIKKLYKFISSKTSMLYQMKSQLDAILVILEKSKSIHNVNINRQIDEMKFRISSYLQINNDDLDKINILIDRIVSNTGPKKINSIKYFKKVLVEQLINPSTIIFLEKNYINPPPNFLLPKFKKYSRSIVRTPESNPINPMEIFEKNINLSVSNSNDQVLVNQAVKDMIIPVDNVFDKFHNQSVIDDIMRNLPPKIEYTDNLENWIDQEKNNTKNRVYSEDELESLDDFF